MKAPSRSTLSPKGERAWSFYICAPGLLPQGGEDPEFLHFGRGGHAFAGQCQLLGKAVDEPTVEEFENLLAQLFAAGSLVRHDLKFRPRSGYTRYELL